MACYAVQHVVKPYTLLPGCISVLCAVSHLYLRLKSTLTYHPPPSLHLSGQFPAWHTHTHTHTHTFFLQVDALRPGLLGSSKDDFASRYCAKRRVPIRTRGGGVAYTVDCSGLERGPELHMLLKQVCHSKHGLLEKHCIANVC